MYLHPIRNGPHTFIEEMDMNILKEQANWFKQYGRSQQVLEKKIAGEVK